MRVLRRSRRRDPIEAQVRPVAWRLALLTVGLTGTLVLVMALAVYLTVRGALATNLQRPLTVRAQQQVAELENLVRHPAHEREPQDMRAGVFTAFVDNHLRVVGGSTSPFGRALPDSKAAAQALRTAQPVFSTKSPVHGQQYLLYSKPVIVHKHVLGVIQTGIPAQQYADNLAALLRILALVGALGLVVSAAISTLVVWRALQPIRSSLRRQRDFVSDAAHELRTPVTVIRSTAELGLGIGGSDQHQGMFERILQQSRHLTRMIGDLSLLARADSGALLLDRRPLNPGKLVHDTIADLEPLAEDRGVRLTFQPRAEIRMLGDADRLRQVLVILLDNALRHTPMGGAVTVTLDQDGAQARLEVRDTGRGIAPEDLPHVFNRFYRAAHTDQTESVGLGLSIAQGITRAHGGRMVAGNAPDGGAVFTVILPVDKGARH